MKVIKGTEQELKDLVIQFDDVARSILTLLGRTFNTDGELVNLQKGQSHSTTTKTYGTPTEDNVQGWYLVHPDSFPHWEQPYRDQLKAKIAEASLEVDVNFMPTPEEEI